MKLKLSIFIATICFFLPLALFFAPLFINYGKTAQNTYLLDKDYSGLTREQIYARLDSDFLLPASITLKTEEKTYPLNLASISAQINKKDLATSLLSRRLDQGIIPYIRYFFLPKSFTLQSSLDDQALDKELSLLAVNIDKPFVPSELELNNGIVSIKSGQLGRKVNIEELKNQILSSLDSWQVHQDITIPVDTIGFLPSPNQINDTISQAKKLIGKSFTLTSDNGNADLDDKTLISWLDFNGQLSGDDLNDFVANTANSLKRDPVNAVFKFENNKVLEFLPAKDGLVVDQSQLVVLLQSSLNDLTISAEKNISLPIPVTTSSPSIRTEDVNNLGIKDLLGTGKSTFKHSSATRNFNVEKGASIVNRILVAPGEEFSFIKNLGEVTLEAGYKKAYIIRQGKTELDVGGGICQVSTTLFRAMLNSGLNITDRHPHAYRVGYYEEDSPPGYDATVFIPSPDLKFINDTGHYVLIQSKYDGVNKALVYEIYGTNDGRKVEISNYRKWGTAPPPPDVWIDDPTLPPGKVVQDEHRIAGLKTAFDWKVTRGIEVLHEQTFQSYYVPWAAVYRRGI